MALLAVLMFVTAWQSLAMGNADHPAPGAQEPIGLAAVPALQSARGALIVQGTSAALIVALAVHLVWRAWHLLVRRPWDDEVEPVASAPLPPPKAAAPLLLPAAARVGKSDTLEALRRIADQLTATPVSQRTLAKALEELARSLGATAAGIRLSAETGSALHCEGLLSLATAPAALTAPDMAMGSSTFVSSHRAADGRVVGSLGVPMRQDGDTFALLALERAEPARFTGAEIALAQIAATLMAMSLSGVNRGQAERRGALLAERAAIARELHDSLAQSLAFLKIQVAQLQVALRDAPASDTPAQLALELRRGLSSAYRQVKELIAAFRVRMGAHGLRQALEESIEEFSRKGGASVTLDFRLPEHRLTVNEEFHLLQIVREALSNTVRHARATHVAVSLHPVGDGQLIATVADDGLGFDPAIGRAGHYGLSIMRERAASLGGELAVTGGPDGGTCVRLAFTPAFTLPEHAP